MSDAIVGTRSESTGVPVPVAAALAGNAVEVLDAWQHAGLHEQWTYLRKFWRVPWPCPCRKCSPKPPRIAVSPTGPTAFDVEACVFEHRRRGIYLSPEKARALLLDGGNAADEGMREQAPSGEVLITGGVSSVPTEARDR